MTKNASQSLLNNSRFYILATSFLLSVAIIGGVRLMIPADQLFYIRTQQIYGLLAICFWYFALIISPIGYLIGKHRTKKLEFARRAIGVSAFYFVLLHGAIALWGQLGGLSQLANLPDLFKWSLLAGSIAFGILTIMALTSFDKVVKFMTYRKWKWLHRLVYVGGALAVLHVWTVGTHLAYEGVQLTAFFALVALIGLELFRMTKLLNEKYWHLEKAETFAVFATAWVVLSIVVLSMPAFVQNYHSRHLDHGDASIEEGEHS